MEFTVEADDSVLLTIIWSPKKAGSYRELVQFQVDDVFRLTTILFGKAEEPVKPKKVKEKYKFAPCIAIFALRKCYISI